MAFIDNKKFKEIRESAGSGNEKALMIMQAFRNGTSQDDIDKIVYEYYNIDPHVDEVPVEEVNEETIIEEQPVQEELIEEIAPEEAELIETIPQEDIQEDIQEVDLTDILNKELDGIVTENEIEDTPFSSFVSNKIKDYGNSKKNKDYFVAFDKNGRDKYYNDKVNAYKGKFDGRLKDIDRRFKDVDKSLEEYTTKANMLLDDEIENDMDKTFSAYKDFATNERAMGSFGRYWDENDMEDMYNALKELASVYGKKNVIAALNILKTDNNNYRDFLNNQVDEEFGRYSKSLEKLLK